MSCCDNVVLVFFQVFESVLGPSEEELSTLNVMRVPWDLEASSICVKLRWNAQRTRAQQPALIPVPNQNLPIRWSCQGD